MRMSSAAASSALRSARLSASLRGGPGRAGPGQEKRLWWRAAHRSPISSRGGVPPARLRSAATGVAREQLHPRQRGATQPSLASQPELLERGVAGGPGARAPRRSGPAWRAARRAGRSTSRSGGQIEESTSARIALQRRMAIGHVRRAPGKATRRSSPRISIRSYSTPAFPCVGGGLLLPCRRCGVDLCLDPVAPRIQPQRAAGARARRRFA